MRSTTVAFRGTKQVVDAYIANDMSSWAICNGKDIMFAQVCDTVDDGQTLLMEILKKMQNGGSRASFTLRVYEVSGNEKINSATPFSRSFPFALYSDDEYSPYESGRQSYAGQAQEKIDKLEAELEILKIQMKEAEEDREPEKLSGVEGVLAGIMGMPGIKEFLSAKLIGFVNAIVPMTNNNMPGGIAGIQGPASEQRGVVNVLEPGQDAKVNQALNILCTMDPLLGDHLLGVAAIAESSPSQYNFLIGMLKK